jgi:t-SNARE complex subunit (syntaxin)
MQTSETHYRQDNRNQYEMQGMGYGNAPVIQQQAGKSQNDFFDEVSLRYVARRASTDTQCKVDQLSATLNNLKRVIEQISNLHTRVLTSSADEQREHEAREELEYTTKDMQRQMAAAKNALETLAAWPPTQGGENDKQARRMQVGSQKKK